MELHIVSIVTTLIFSIFLGSATSDIPPIDFNPKTTPDVVFDKPDITKPFTLLTFASRIGENQEYGRLVEGSGAIALENGMPNDNSSGVSFFCAIGEGPREIGSFSSPFFSEASLFSINS